MIPAELLDVALFSSIERFGDMAIHAVIDVSRAYSREELERAVRATIEDFPVFGRCYEARFWRDVWRPVEGPISDVVHEVVPTDLEAETDRWLRRPIDTTRERPIRVVSLRRDRGSRLVLSVMHLAVDGAGAAAVAHVFGAHLHGIAPAAPVDARRSVGIVLDRIGWKHLPVLARDAADGLLLPLRMFLAARRERHFPEDSTAEASWRWIVLSAPELARLKERCGTTINDVLVAALARVSAARSTGGPVTVTYTMDLRRYTAAPRLSAANTSTILTTVVPRQGVGDLAITARAVAELTRRHRHGLAGPAFVLGPIALGMASPHGLLRKLAPLVHPLLVDLPLSRGLLVTNVGRVDDGIAAFGDTIERVRIVGPSIRGVRVPAIVAYGFRGELHLELFAPPGLGEAALDELERELRDALELA